MKNKISSTFILFAVAFSSCKNSKDIFEGNWIDCNDVKYSCTVTRQDETYILRDSYKKNYVFEKRADEVLSGISRDITIKFDKQTNQLIVKGIDNNGEAYNTLLCKNSNAKAPNAFQDNKSVPETVTDFDENIYNVVRIGNQVWMKENLQVTHYQNGDPISNVTDDVQWSNTKKGAWCDYDNSNTNSSINGKLYNWYSITDNRNIAPIGWHVPTDDDWTILRNYLNDNIAGRKLKSTTEWNGPGLGDNNTGFSAFPSGIRTEMGIFESRGDLTRFWSTTDYTKDAAWNCGLFSKYDISSRDGSYKASGFSVRCVKD